MTPTCWSVGVRKSKGVLRKEQQGLDLRKRIVEDGKRNTV
jgi:hypothetical protein